jgi:DNA-binding GntR family transcriptional regulator
VSQAVKAQLALRELILGGELKAGARIAELWLVERLNVSRTPVRLALVKLAEEGLLDALPAGGYAVKDFSESDIHDAIEVRGTMEGLAVRLAAERGVAPVLIAEARECLERIDEALARPELTDATFSVYVEQNARFHALLSEMADSPLVSRQLEKATAVRVAQRLRDGAGGRTARARHSGGRAGPAPHGHRGHRAARGRARRGADARARAHRAAQPAAGAAKPQDAAAGAGREPDPTPLGALTSR